MNKRGYFFIVDAVIASVIMFVGLFVILGGSVHPNESVQPLVTIEDLTTTFALTPLTDTVDNYYVYTLLPAGLVSSLDSTPLEEVAYLWYLNKSGVDTQGHAKNYTLSLFDNALGEAYGAELVINGTSIAQKAHTARYTFVRHVIVYTRINSTTVIGPVPAEIRLWG